MNQHRRRRSSIGILPQPTTLARSRSLSLSMMEVGRARSNALENLMADGFPYSRRLSAHTSCINALAFSSGDGRFLATGGDDLKIQLWDFHSEDVVAPSHSLVGPRGNIFCLDFSANNKYLISGGTDDTVLKYDISHLGAPLVSTGPKSPNEIIQDHNDSIRGISCHPVQDELFLSGSESGTIIYHDGRTPRPTRAQNKMQLTAEVTGIEFHPAMDHIFATSESSGKVCLRDARMAFGPLTQRTRHGVVQTYNTKLSRQSVRHLAHPESSSVSFDRDGSKLAVTMLRFQPTIYSVSDPHPIATCSGSKLPDGSPIPPSERTYSNACTMKHGSFGGPASEEDDLYSAGSDDFRGYVWKLPPISELLERRQKVKASDWAADQWRSVTAFAEGFWETRYVPVEVDTPLCHLRGHRSIVNTTLFHPHLPHVVTSGIERDVILHSPTPSSPCIQNLLRTSTDVRRLSDDDEEDRHVYYRALAGIQTDEDDDPEANTIRLFDFLLREESGADVFLTRRWLDAESTSSSSSSSSSDEEEDTDIDIDDAMTDADSEFFAAPSARRQNC